MEIRKFRIKIDGKIFEAEVEEIEKEGGKATQKTKSSDMKEKKILLPQVDIDGKGIVAPMPGKIVSVKVSSGQKIIRGETVLILEAMKMEQEIKSEQEGTVTSINVSIGDTVKKGQILVSIA